MGWPAADLEHMRAALAEAEAGAGEGEVPVGAVVVTGGSIVGAGHNRTIADHDPSAHAEIVAIRQAAAALGNHRLGDATLYVTLEPCTMCVGAIAEARLARVVFGAYDDKSGALGSVLDLDGERALRHRFEVSGGVLAGECGAPLRAFFASRRG